MSFKPFGFTYTPPPTVPTPPPASTPLVSSSPNVGVGGTSSGANSVAGQIIGTLNDLTVMSQFLQDAIVALTGNTAIEIDPSVDPVTAKALASIYGTDSPPSFITINMYDNLLDAHFGALQLDMAVGNNSSIQPNPMQVSDLMATVSAINSHLIGAPSFNNWLPLQLASLKGDSIVFQSMAEAFSTYPAFYSTNPLAPGQLPAATTIQASTLDVSAGLAAYHNDALNRFCQAYTNVYQSMAVVSPAAAAAGDIMGVFFTQPLSTMVQISAMLSSLLALSHKPNMEALTGDLINYTFARLASDTSSMLVNLDQLVALTARNITTNATGSLSAILTSVAGQVAAAGTISTGSMAGMSQGNSCAAGGSSITSSPLVRTPAFSSLPVPGIGTISEGLKQMAESINWAQTQMTGGLSLLDKSFRQLTERRLTTQGNMQSLMCSINALTTIAGLAAGVVSELQKGTLTANSSPQQQQEAAGRILTSLQTGSNTTFTTSSGSVIANPPTLPAVTLPVQRILARGGVTSTAGRVQV